MMRSRLLSIGGSLALALGCCGPEASAETLADAAKSNNTFGFSLLGRSEGKDDNFICSPFSIWSALAMTSAGAESETLQEMHTVLSLPAKDSHDLVSGWSVSLGKAREVQMKVANRLWGRKGLPFRPDFLKLTGQQYQAGVETVDFPGNPDAARQQINRWVADNTEDKIKDLLAPGVITSATELVLTNAIYFKGKWSIPFDPDNTRKRGFTLSSGQKVDPETMHGTFPIAYMEDERLKAVKLRYQGGDMAMIIVLPRKADALVPSSSFLDASGFTRVLTALKDEPRVVVQLPRFEASTSLQLAKTLKAMGMPRAFTDDAQFGLLCEKPLKISEVIHQAWVKVGEKGTEAAAATAVVMRPTGAAMRRKEDPPKLFIADHPFLFFVVDDRNGGIVFAGRIMDPSK